jgi:hypothetical protein
MQLFVIIYKNGQSLNLKQTIMAKSNEGKEKLIKKAPAKTLKEKRIAKEAKREGKNRGSNQL